MKREIVRMGSRWRCCWMRRSTAILAAARPSSDFISASAEILPDYSSQSGSRGEPWHQNLTIEYFSTRNNLVFSCFPSCLCHTINNCWIPTTRAQCYEMVLICNYHIVVPCLTEIHYLCISTPDQHISNGGMKVSQEIFARSACSWP